MRMGLASLMGWLLTLGGLLLVLVVVYLAMNRYVFEAMALSLPSVIVFRAGIGLLRLTMAARIAAGLPDRASAADVAP
jgi:hypothetical protein